jgi:glycerate 2-kinase
MTSRETALEIFNHALRSVLPESLIKESVRLEGENLIIMNESYDLGKFDRVRVLGSGKASSGMARTIQKILGKKMEDGFVVSNKPKIPLNGVRFFEGSHPIPTEKSIRAASILIERISGLSENDLFIYLLSGGSSSLVEKPIPPIGLGELRETTDILLKKGVPIEDINVVRKHLSMIKGGRLGRMTRATGIVLVISDVIGDDLETIGSAPFYYDSSSYKDAYDTLKEFELWDVIPGNVKNVIESGLSGNTEETPKKENRNIRHFMIGNNLTALKNAKEMAEKLGLKTEIVNSKLRGEARDVARDIVLMDRGMPEDTCLIFGGETTVTLRGRGFGGRNQEMCLSALKEIGDNKDITFLSAGTDGIDGNSQAAGAIVDYKSYEKARKLNLDIDKYLRNNDSYNFLDQTGDLIITGPTGTNVMDVTILLVR